jgi:S1-C subfamily serine protease
MKDTEAGPMIESVSPNSAGGKAGLQGAVYRVPVTTGWGRPSGYRYDHDFDAADYIVAVNGAKVSSVAQFMEKIYGSNRDTDLVLRVKRGPSGKERDVRLGNVWG